MNITLPQIKNSGFLTKKVQVTYAKPQTLPEYAGDVPCDSYVTLPNGFVASTLEKPNFPRGLRTEKVMVDTPQLDENGKPKMTTATETFSVPGPKAQALGKLAGGLGTGLAAGVILGAPTAASLTLCEAILDSDPNALVGFKVALGVAAFCTAVGVGLGIAEAISAGSKTNSLTWETSDIASKKLTGYRVSSVPTVAVSGRTRFNPRFDETVHGQWSKPALIIH